MSKQTKSDKLSTTPGGQSKGHSSGVQKTIPGQMHVGSPTSQNQIILGPQTGLREVFQTGPQVSKNNNSKPLATTVTTLLANNQLGQAAQLSNQARQANSVKPVRGGGQQQQRNTHNNTQQVASMMQHQMQQKGTVTNTQFTPYQIVQNPGISNAKGNNVIPSQMISRTAEPKGSTNVSSGQQSRTRMTNQLQGMNANPIHVLSAGATDLLQNHNSGSMSPTYQNFGFSQINNNTTKLNPYFTSAGGLNSDPRQQKNSGSTGRQGGRTGNNNLHTNQGKNGINLTNRPYQTIGHEGLSDRSLKGLDSTAVVATNAYVHQDFNAANHHLSETIDQQPQQQMSTATLTGTSGGRRAVSNPKTFMRARMAQQKQNNTIAARSKSRTHALELGTSSRQKSTVGSQHAYNTGAPSSKTASKGGSGGSKAAATTQQDKKLTQNFMKVPRGAAGLIGGNLDGPQSYLQKQQQLLMNNSELHGAAGTTSGNTSSQRLLEKQQQNAIDREIFYQNQGGVVNPDVNQKSGNKSRYGVAGGGGGSSTSNNQQSKKKQGQSNNQQPYGAVKQQPQMAFSDTQGNALISEGALSQLINSHINEGDTLGSAQLPNNNQANVNNDSFENVNGNNNLAFWTRKQNEYKANLITNNNKANNTAVGGATANNSSIMSNNQTRIMTHLMSFDETDTGPAGAHDKIKTATSDPITTTGIGISNPRSPHSQNRTVTTNQMSLQERLENDSIQLLTAGLQPPSTTQQQYIQNSAHEQLFFEKQHTQGGGQQTKAVFMQDQMHNQKRAQSTIRVQARGGDMTQETGVSSNKRDKSTGNAIKGKHRATSKVQHTATNNLVMETAIGSGRNLRTNNIARDNLLSTTYSEERVTTNATYTSTTQQNTGGVRRVKMRQVPPTGNNQSNTNGGSRVNSHASKERNQSRVRVRLQKRNGPGGQQTDVSKDDNDRGSSLENIVNAVVSVNHGEFSLKSNNGPGDNRNGGNFKRNTIQDGQSKTDLVYRGGVVVAPGQTAISKGAIGSHFDSPQKGGPGGSRQVYNKTQTLVVDDPKNGLVPTTRQILPSNGKHGLQYSKWADSNEMTTSPKFTANQITFVPTKKMPVLAAGNGAGGTRETKQGGVNSRQRGGGRKPTGGAQTSDLTIPSNRLPQQNNQAMTKLPSQQSSTIQLNKFEGRTALSKSIIVNQNRKQIIQSLGRYNDVMSQENFEQEFEIIKNTDGGTTQGVANLYQLDDSFDSGVQQQRIAALQAKTAVQKKGNQSAGDGMTTSGGQTAATSGNHYFASRNFAASFAFDHEGNKQPDSSQIDASARKKQTTSGQNALLSLISMDDFEGIRNQIHSKIKDKIDENPASEEDEEGGNGPRVVNANQADEVINETSPLNARLRSRRKAADAH